MAEKWTASTPFQGPGEEGAVGGALHVNNGLQAACVLLLAEAMSVCEAGLQTG